MKAVGAELPVPSMAPTAGEHTDELLAEVCGYDAERIAALHAGEALGPPRADH
ncbi:MAG TPA: hypothetical protein PKA98_05475 [Acidimicrobiales bacterium]|nr:hypothetical protein [Acidimicrobiales bacterium]